MQTPKGNTVKWTQLGGNRWRLEMGAHRLFIQRVQIATARIEHERGDILGTYDWDGAVRDAMRTFDIWADEERLTETLDESTEEAETMLLLRETLDKMQALGPKLMSLLNLQKMRLLKKDDPPATG